MRPLTKIPPRNPGRTTMETKNGRRDFLKLGAGLGAAAAIGAAGSAPGRAAEDEPKVGGAKPIETVRVGFVGVGIKGSEHFNNLLRIPGVEVKAVCDIREEACASARRQAEAQGKR